LSFADVRHAELFSELLSNTLIPSAKLRGGHSCPAEYGAGDCGRSSTF
jgi:hypothetical protein